MRLNTSPVTTSHDTQIRTWARRASVRAARARSTNATTPSTSAAGSSQAICPPISEPNNLVRPVEPHMLPCAPPPPTDPVSSPVIRPSPL